MSALKLRNSFLVIGGYFYEKITMFALAFMLTLLLGVLNNSEVNAQILTFDDGFCVNLNPKDTILYQKELITDEKQLCSLAEKNTHNEIDSTTTIHKLPDDTSVASESTNIEKIDIPTKSYSQHYLTIQRATGEIERYYCIDSFADIPQDIMNGKGVSPSSEGEIVTPGAGATDPTYSARAWAKIHYVEGTRQTSTEYNEYIKGMWYRGTVYRSNNSVTVSKRRIYFRNHGYDLYTHKYQKITLGPYYADNGAETVTRYAPSSFYTLLTYPEVLYELTCTCQANLSQGGNTWSFQTSVSKNSY